MSLKRRIKRAAEKKLVQGDVVFARGCEITYQAMHHAWHSRLPRHARDAMRRLRPAIQGDEPDDAVIHELERLIEAYPFAPVFYNYLVVAYSRRGMHQLAEQTADKVLRRIPDYLFARLNRAEQLLWNGTDAEIRALLGPTLELADLYPDRKRFHVSEFAGFYGVVGLMELRSGNRHRAAEILDLLQAVAPEEHATLALAGEFERPQLLKRVARFVRTRARPYPPVP